jgi:hypothetical protein
MEAAAAIRAAPAAGHASAPPDAPKGSTMSEPYDREHVRIILDVPGTLGADPARREDVLNLILDRIAAALERDAALQRALRDGRIELGWEAPSWEQPAV